MTNFDLSQATLEQLNSLTHEVVNQFDEDKFLVYQKRSIDLGNKFMVDAISQGEPDYEDRSQSFEYGTSTVKLRRTPHDPLGWSVLIGGGLYPGYRVKPIMVDRESFAQEMRARNIPEEKLAEFFQHIDKGSHLEPGD